MRTVVWRLYIDYEKEENWLNEMAAKGFAFADYSFARYVFNDCKPGEYIYRLELLKNGIHNPESRQYMSFMADNGAEPVANWYRWVYFRKKAGGAPFDIYSDVDSKMAHYKRIMGLYFPVMCLLFLSGFWNIRIGLPYFYSEFWNGSPANFTVGVLNVCIGIALFFPWNHARTRVKKLKQEKLLME